jgi:hypothetical protein
MMSTFPALAPRAARPACPLHLTPLQYSVYLKESCLTASAPHRASRTVVKLVMANFPTRPLGQHVIQVLSSDSWQEIKRHIRRPADLLSRPARLYIPEILPSPELPGLRFLDPALWRSAERIRAAKVRCQHPLYDLPAQIVASNMVQL